MAQVINTNVASLNAQRNLTTSQTSLATSLQRLSSGLRINSAKDDAAGLAISERMTSQIRGLNQAVRNANDGISLAQTAEGALGEIGNNLQRIRELAVQSRNATNSTSDRAALQSEVTQLKAEIQRVSTQTQFNGLNLLDGSFTAQTFQVGANQGQTIDVANIVNAQIAQLGSWNSVATPTTTDAAGAFTTVNLADGKKYTMNVGGVDVVSKTASGAAATVTAAEVDAGLSAKKTDLANAGITFSGSAAGGDLKFAKADGTSMDIKVTNEDTATSGFAGTQFKKTDGTAVTVNNGAASAAKTGFDTLDISTTGGADNAILAMDAALKAVNSGRADLGAIQNRFSSVITTLQTTSENLSASRSRIQDTDFAAETANMTKNQILQQAGTAMLAQANSLPQNVLSLLK